MKTIWIPIISLSICLLTGLQPLQAGKIPISKSFDISDISHTTQKLGDAEFLTIQWGTEMMNSGEIGAPSLPKQWISFAIPNDATNISIDNVTVSNEAIKQWSTDIIPVQEPTPTDGRALIETLPNPDYYTCSEFMPSELVCITGI